MCRRELSSGKAVRFFMKALTGSKQMSKKICLIKHERAQQD